MDKHEEQNRALTAELRACQQVCEKTEFNLGFGLPRTDTCSWCDELSLAIKQAENGVYGKTLNLVQVKSVQLVTSKGTQIY